MQCENLRWEYLFPRIRAFRAKPRRQGKILWTWFGLVGFGKLAVGLVLATSVSCLKHFFIAFIGCSNNY
jgi:hypothetical protein